MEKCISLYYVNVLNMQRTCFAIVNIDQTVSIYDEPQSQVQQVYMKGSSTDHSET